VITLDGTKVVPPTTTHEALFCSFCRTHLTTLIVLIFLMCILYRHPEFFFYKITASRMCCLSLSWIGSNVEQEPKLSPFKSEIFSHSSSLKMEVARALEISVCICQRTLLHITENNVEPSSLLFEESGT
jgi:hypothetical protein